VRSAVVIPLRRAATVLVALCASLIASRVAAGNPSRDVAKARAEYERGNFQAVINLLAPEMPKISDRDEMIEGHWLLGASYVYVGKFEEAKREFSELLFIDPDFKVDPLMVDADVYASFDTTRTELKRQLDEIRRLRAEEEARKKRPSVETVIEKEIRSDPPWMNFIPFGVGQFRNGQRTKGYVYLAIEAALAGTSIGLFAAQAIQYGIPSKVPNDEDEIQLVRTMQVIQIAAGGAFFIVYGIGVADAFSNQKPKITTRTYTRPLPSSSDSAVQPSSLVPIVVPVLGPGFVGVAATWEL
jgi:hypothetical protein